MTFILTLHIFKILSCWTSLYWALLITILPRQSLLPWLLPVLHVSLLVPLVASLLFLFFKKKFYFIYLFIYLFLKLIN